MFTALLHEDDARRVTETVGAVLAHGLRCALTGGRAIAAQLGRFPSRSRRSFLLHHVHPDAIEGKTLLQLIDEATAVRVDLFRPFGNTLARASALDDETGALHVLSVEDLVARATALVCGSLRLRKKVDAKHATAFACLLGVGRQQQLAVA